MSVGWARSEPHGERPGRRPDRVPGDRVPYRRPWPAPDARADDRRRRSHRYERPDEKGIRVLYANKCQA